jgi:hypothetical protein
MMVPEVFMTARARYWSDQVALWERSGLSQTAFCEREGLHYGTFGWWKRQLRSAGMKQPNRRGRAVGTDLSSVPKRRGRPARASGRFVEVRLSGSSPSSAYEVFLSGGRSIRVPSEFDPQVLSRLITAVESC